MQQIFDKVTFRSISGGRFRCVQTGKVTTNSKRYRLAMLRKISHRPLPPITMVPSTRPLEKDISSDVYKRWKI